MRNERLFRGFLWVALALTADANRRHYRLPTAWVPHGIGNSLILWLPELLAPWRARLSHAAPCSTPAAVGAALADVVSAPGYALAIAPAVLGYVFSHPRCDIYRGAWGEKRVGGFGLDAIPHSGTAFGLTALLRQGFEALGRRLPVTSPLRPLTRWAAARPGASSGLALLLLSLAWESGEYRIQQAELRAVGFDYSRINMHWDWDDTTHDLLANTLGWLVATLCAARGLFGPPAPTHARADGTRHT